MTGAGVSAASGVPTFRGPDGIWKKYRAESLATPEAFAKDPRLVWEWYDWRRQVLSTKTPNRAHEVLAAVEPPVSAIHVDHAERRWAARARRHGKRDPLSRFDMGGPLLEQLWFFPKPVAGRDRSVFRNSSTVSAL